MKNHICKFVVLLICFSMGFNTFADYKIDEFFNGLNPHSHIYRNYSNERKNALKGDTILYEDIDDILHLYNPEILNNWNSWENNKSAQDIYDDYQDAADSLFASASGQDSEMQEAMIKAQGTAMQIQADKNTNDSYINFLTNYIAEKKLILETKIIDINYQKSSYEILKASEGLNEAKRKEETATNAYNYGNGTQLELLTAKKAVIDANSAIITAQSLQNTYKRNLLINCGRSMNDEIYIAPVNLDFGIDILSINLDEDYKVALKNNYQLEIYKRKIENARTEEVKNEFKILYEAAPEKIFNDLESKYSNIIDAMDSRNNREISYNLAKDDLQKANNEYANGNISLKEFKTKEYNKLVAEINYQSSIYDIKIAVENYLSSKEGFGSC